LVVAVDMAAVPPELVEVEVLVVALLLGAAALGCTCRTVI